MMGILIMLCGAAGLGLSIPLAIIGLNIQRKAMVTHAGGSWPLYWSIAVVAAVIVIGIGVAYLSTVRSTPPKADEFFSVMKALFLFGVAPGVGMLTGAVAVFIK